MDNYTLLSLGAFLGIATASYTVSGLIARWHKYAVKGFAAEKSSATDRHNSEYGRKVFIPNILQRWPWTRRVNQSYFVAKESADWTASFRAFSPRAQRAFDRGNFGLLGCMAFADAKKEHLRTACDFMNLVFVVDEYTDASGPAEVRKQKDIIMDTLRNPHKPRPPGEWVVGEMHRQFWQRTLPHSSKQFQKRFIASYDAYLEGVAQQAVDRSGNYIRDIQNYFDIRRDTIGAKPAFALIEMDLDIPDEVMSHPAIQVMVYAAIDMIVIGNDITSYNIEQSCGNDEHNIITILMRELGTDVNGAMLWAQDFHTKLELKFLAAMAALPQWDEPLNSHVREYCSGLGQWVRANDDWEFEGGRYFGNKGVEIREKRWVSLLPKEPKHDRQEIGPPFVDSSLL